MKKYFVTGTDTDCGKTYVVCQLLNWFHQQGYRAQALKPLASGCFQSNGQLLNQDVIQLQQHNYDSTQIINHWLYEPPISPHLAAQKVGDNLTADTIAKFCNDNMHLEVDFQLIEGAGGLLVPLNDQETWLDFIKITRMPVILVVAIRLGCINHALLTDEVLKLNAIPCAGWVANVLDENTLVVDEIILTLKNKMHMPLLATVLYCGIIKEINFI